MLTLTLLAGPSTTLRDDLVRCLVLRRPGLVAVAYDVEPGPGGLRLVRRVLDARGTCHTEAVETESCCLSCAVRADVAPALAQVLAAERWEEAVLALPAGVTPASVVQVLAEHDLAVDTVTTVVDALLLRAQVSGDDLLCERGLAVAPTDRRSTAELVVAQLEDADVLAVAHLHRVGTETARTVQALLAHLVPTADQVPLAPGGVGCEELVSTGRRSSLTVAAREQLSFLAAELCPPSCGVHTVRWLADRPLHAGRLHQALAAVVDRVVRSRGHVWLADRPGQRVRWESAGGSLSLGDPEPWDAVPGCALLLTGVDLDADGLRARLDACLATDGELRAAQAGEDPFADVLGPV